MIDTSSGASQMATSHSLGDVADLTKPPAVTLISSGGNQDTYIVRDHDTMQRMMDSQRVIQGKMTVDEMQMLS